MSKPNNNNNVLIGVVGVTTLLAVGAVALAGTCSGGVQARVTGGTNTCAQSNGVCKAPPAVSYKENSGLVAIGGGNTSPTMSLGNGTYDVERVLNNTVSQKRHQDQGQNAMFNAAAMMKPDVAEHTQFMAQNKVENWAPGVADMPQKITNANMHQAVLRQPIYDGLDNRAPIIPFHPPPRRVLPSERPDILDMGFGFSERFASVYTDNTHDDRSGQYTFMGTKEATNKWTGDTYPQVQQGPFR